MKDWPTGKRKFASVEEQIEYVINNIPSGWSTVIDLTYEDDEFAASQDEEEPSELVRIFQEGDEEIFEDDSVD